MADTAVAITAGSGTNIDTRTEATNGNHRQVVVIGDPSTNAGGGLIKRFKLLLEQLPNNKQGADEIMHMAFFDPAVAAYLLDRPLPSPNSSLYNVNLRRLIAAGNSARESGPEEE